MSDGFDLVNRERGILTTRDREFLRGELNDELTKNEQYQKRYQIRQRIRNSMFDFWILNQNLSNRDTGMLWDGTDDWVYRSRRQRNRGEAPPYPDVPFLAKCWREIVAFFVYSQISTGITESERLVEWVIEQGVNKAVRRYHFDRNQMYQEVDAKLNWGTGERYRLQEYLQHLGQKVPRDSNEAEDYLLDLQRRGFLQHNHVVYLYHTYVENPH